MTKTSILRLTRNLLFGLAILAAPARAAVTIQDADDVIGTGPEAWSYLKVEGESYETETAPDEGAGFTRVDASGSRSNLVGSLILAPNTTASGKGALFTQTTFGRHIDKVTYRVQFARPGEYYLYMRFTMFENGDNTSYLNEDSFFLPPDFNKDPQNDWPLMDSSGQNGGYVEGCCDGGFLTIKDGGQITTRNTGDEEGRAFWEGNFHWSELASSQFLNPETQGQARVRFKYTVTQDMVGKPQEFTISYREGGVTIDLFLFSTSETLLEDYTQAELDELLLGSSGVTVQNSTDVVGTGADAWWYLKLEGESYVSETDSAEGVGFTRVDASGSRSNLVGSLILATNTTASGKGALFTQTAFGRHIDKVTYRVQFAKAGDYYLYMRFTMFENGENTSYLNEDSFFLPPDFNKDPQNDWPLIDSSGQNGGYVEGCCDGGFLTIKDAGTITTRNTGDEEGRAFWEGNFHWSELASSQFLNPETQGQARVRFKYTVTEAMVGKPLDFTISYREGGVTIDMFLFSTSETLLDDYSQAQLDQLLLGSAAAGPQLAISRQGANAVISWPTSATGFVLESSPTLGNATWTAVGTAPTVVGERNTVTVSVATGNRYYRLRRQ